jgi:glutamate dehydrogenase/leucine dehydrogenase
VFVSYLEYIQETQFEQMAREQVVTRLQTRMAERFAQVQDLATTEKIHLRDAAMHLAISSVCQALKARGYQP